MTSVNVPERMNELSDGVIRAVHATTEGGSGSILEIPVWMPLPKWPKDRQQIDGRLRMISE